MKGLFYITLTSGQISDIHYQMYIIPFKILNYSYLPKPEKKHNISFVALQRNKQCATHTMKIAHQMTLLSLLLKFHGNK